MSSIANQMINARNTRGLTVEQLAIKVGISEEKIRNIESGLEQPDILLLETIASELNYMFHIGNVAI